MPPRDLWNFLRLTRPIFLFGGALMYGLGILIAGWQGAALDWGRAILGQLMITIIQVTAHYSNEYYDVEVDRLISNKRTLFSGGSGVLPAGSLPASVALAAARTCALIGIATVVLTLAVEPVAGLAGALTLVGSWFYASPPLSLMRTGWGELTTSLIVAVLTPLTGYVLQRGHVDRVLFAVTLPLLFIHWAMMIAFEFADYEADSAAGKKTLVVRLGKARAALLHTALVTGAGVQIIVTALNWTAARLLWWMLPLAVWQIAAVLWQSRGYRTRPHPLTLGAVGLFGLTAMLWLAGLISG